MKRKGKLFMIFYIAAFICLFYCIGIVLTKAAGTRFFLIWIFIAAAFAGLGRGMQTGWFDSLPAWLRIGGAVCICVGILGFGFVEGLIMTRFYAKGEKQLPYIIVLGAQMKQNGPSVALAKRLDRAYVYLTENPDTICVVSGGQGSNEPVTEAQGMYEYLVKKGISPDRILQENRSRDTQQNLEFSRELIPEEITGVGIVTSNFHVYRGVQLARHQGFTEAVGIAAPSGIYFLPNNMLREFFGVAKDWVFGNMKLLK